MAFLDNSGDIILDAVLTDTGRLRLAKGDGSFKISKYAFGDDEINYSLFNKSHPSGSAYYDLDILQTPIFEAFTNNASTMKSFLISNPNSQLLYLPSLIHTQLGNAAKVYSSFGVITIAANQNTYTDFQNTTSNIINGDNSTGTVAAITIDQGLNTAELSTDLLVSAIDAASVETSYIIELNNNLLILCDKNKNKLDSGNNSALSYIDDDGIASYSVSLSSNPSVVSNLVNTTNGTGGTDNTSLIGPRDKRIEFTVQTKTDVKTNDYLYSVYGGETTIGSTTYKYIDTTVTVKGLTTGTSITVPLRIIKK